MLINSNFLVVIVFSSEKLRGGVSAAMEGCRSDVYWTVRDSWGQDSLLGDFQ